MGKFLSGVFYMFCFWGFIIVKAWGTAFASWSWLWLLLSPVPWIFRFIVHMGWL